MSAREFSKVSPALWRSARIYGLSLQLKAIYVYYLSNNHVTSAGCYALPDLYGCADLNVTEADMASYRAELIAAGLIDHDANTSEVLIERWFRHNPPMNPKHYKGTSRFVSEIESDRLREKAEAALQEAWEAYTSRQVEEENRKAMEAERRRSQQSNRDLGPFQQAGTTDRLLNSRLMRGAA
jgi:hypothetical protein